jgi:hypothetical protein
VKAEFAGMPQGMPTPAQLAKAFDLLPVNVDPQEFALFLRPRIERLTHAGGLVAVMKEFGTSRSAVPPAVPAAPARAAARGAPTPQQARNEHIEELKLNIAAAERIANNRVMPPPEREHQRQRAADLRAELDKLLDSEEALPAIAAKGGI